MKESSLRRDNSNIIFDEGLRKNSPDELLINSLNNLNNYLDPLEFKKGFDLNFTNTSTNQRDDFIIHESDFKLMQPTFGSVANFLHFRDKAESTLKKVEIFLISTEYINSQTQDINNIIQRMIALLCELNSIATGNHSFNDIVKQALELQAVLLSSLIKFTQLKLTQCHN